MSPSITAGRPALRRLADAAGIIASYLDHNGRRMVTTDQARIALLRTLGLDGRTEARAAECLEAIRARARERLLAPVRVVECTSPEIRRVELRLPRGRPSVGRWRVDLVTEHGERLHSEGSGVRDAAHTIRLPGTPPQGYHALRLTVDVDGVQRIADQTMIVAPSRCVRPGDLLRNERVFGVIANLYTLRSDRNWGVGDLADLESLSAWAATSGADFVGVNPLHALLNRGVDIGPYSPVSRLFKNPIYAAIDRIPELRDAPEVADRLDRPELRAELDALRDATHVRYEQVMAVKGLALDALFRVFVAQRRRASSDRSRAFDAYAQSQGENLTRYATWMAIAESRSRGDAAGADWRRWPADLRNPESAAVRAFQTEHETRIEYHRWVQFEIDRQVAVVARSARDTGMRIGLYEDLAIGSSPAGADTWGFPGLFVMDASLGAPPDPLAAAGQNWGLPPIDPRALATDRYRYFIQLIRGAFRHAGALRIDHVMGFFRQFWIPRDGGSRDRSEGRGAYVRFPANDLLGILALESQRHHALVVGEDLGTVPREVGPAMAKWGLLSSKVLYFERARGGAFRPAARYAKPALATANTHDMPTIAGFWTDRDIETRRRLGLIPSEAKAAAERKERSKDKALLVKCLIQAKALPRGQSPGTFPELRGAVHAFLCKSTAQLVGLSVDDLAGELDAVNVPGVGTDRYPNWSRKMRMSVEEIAASADVRAALCHDRGNARRDRS